MLYLLRIQFTKPEWARKSDFYYAILGAILNLFEDQSAVYTSILKLSFSVGEQLEINMGIQGEEWYNMIVSHLLSHPEQELSINGSKCSLKQINFHFDLFDGEMGEYRDFNKFILRFHSPTFVRQQNITYLLPTPERIIASLMSKFEQIYPSNIDQADFKKWLKNTLFVGECKLESRLIQIKQGKKTGIVWFWTYYLSDKTNIDYVKYLYLLLKSVKYLGMWSGVRLGCGNVSCQILTK